MYRNNSTQYDTNPFANLMQTPYISQRVQFPFEDYLRTLQTVDQNRQKSIADQTQLELLLNSVESPPDDIYSQNKIKEIQSNIETQLNELSGSKFGYADPNAQDKLRILAKQLYTNKDLQQITEFTKAYKADKAKIEAMKQSGKQISQVSKPTLTAFDKNGNKRSYSGGWEERLDREKTKLDLISKLEQDITTTLQLPKDISTEDLYSIFTETKKKEIAGNKINDAAEFYFNSPEGKQEIAEKKYNGYDEEIIKSDIKKEFGRLGKFRESIISDKNVTGNSAYGKEYNYNGRTFYTPYSTGLESDNKVNNAKDLRSVKDDGSYKSMLKTDIMALVNQDKDIQLKQKKVSNLLDEFNKKVGKEKFSELYDVLAEYYNSGGDIENILNPDIFRENWEDIKRQAPQAANFWLNLAGKMLGAEMKPLENTSYEEVKNLSKTIQGYFDSDKELKIFTDSMKDLFSSMDSKAEDILASKGSLGVMPVGISPYDKDFNADSGAIKTYISNAQQSNFIPKYSDKSWDKKSKIVDIPAIYRKGSEIVFVGKDNNGNIYDMDINDPNTRNNILTSFRHPGFIIADYYRDYKGITSDGKSFKLSGNKTEKLPEGYEIKRTIKDNNTFYYLTNKDNQPVNIPVYYDNSGLAQMDLFVRPEDLVFIKYFLDKGKEEIGKIK